MKVFKTKKVVKKTNTIKIILIQTLFLKTGPWSISLAESIATKTGIYQSSRVCTSKNVNIEEKILL
jgi:hypothetical protein